MARITTPAALRRVQALIAHPRLLLRPHPTVINFSPKHREGDLRELLKALPLNVSDEFIREAVRLLYVPTPRGKSNGIRVWKLTEYYSPLELLALLAHEIPLEIARECTTKDLQDVIVHQEDCFTLPQALRVIAHALRDKKLRSNMLSENLSTLIPVAGNGGVHMLVVRLSACGEPILKLSKLGIGRGTNPGSILLSNQP